MLIASLTNPSARQTEVKSISEELDSGLPFAYGESGPDLDADNQTPESCTCRTWLDMNQPNKHAINDLKII